MPEELVMELRDGAISLVGTIDGIDVGRLIEMNVVITFMSIDSS